MHTNGYVITILLGNTGRAADKFVVKACLHVWMM